MHLSFAGCGYLAVYHVGVASCFHEYAPHVLYSRIVGASAGSLIACGVMSRVPFEDLTKAVLDVAVQARAQPLGPLGGNFDINKILADTYNKLLPEDAFRKCSGRLFVSVTRFSDGKNMLLSQFRNNSELIQALICSCFIPVYSGLKAPKFQGIQYIDGGITNNLPILDGKTITVSPFCGETNICPEHNGYIIAKAWPHINFSNTSIYLSPVNLYRISCVLFPARYEILGDVCRQGYQDALRFLQKNFSTNGTGLMSSYRFNRLDSTDSMSSEDDNIAGTENNSSDFDSGYYENSDDDSRQESSPISKNQGEAMMLSLTQYDGQIPEEVEKGIQQVHAEQVKLAMMNQNAMENLTSSNNYTFPFDTTVFLFRKLWETVRQNQLIRPSVSHLLSIVQSLAEQYESSSFAIAEFEHAVEEEEFLNENTPGHNRKKSFELNSGVYAANIIGENSVFNECLGCTYCQSKL